MAEQALKFDDVQEGDEAPAFSHKLTRTDLVMYAGASGDFNPMHTDEVAAQAAGLPERVRPRHVHRRASWPRPSPTTSASATCQLQGALHQADLARRGAHHQGRRHRQARRGRREAGRPRVRGGQRRRRGQGRRRPPWPWRPDGRGDVASCPTVDRLGVRPGPAVHRRHLARRRRRRDAGPTSTRPPTRRSPPSRWPPRTTWPTPCGAARRAFDDGRVDLAWWPGTASGCSSASPR